MSGFVLWNHHEKEVNCGKVTTHNQNNQTPAPTSHGLRRPDPECIQSIDKHDPHAELFHQTLIQPELIPYPIPENWINEPVLTFFHSFDNPDIDQVGHIIIGQHLLNISDYCAYWILMR